MLRILMYALLFILGYRVLRKFFSPGFGNIEKGREEKGNARSTTKGDRSNVVEDVDYEEIE